ncbi:MAG: HD domain-containing phosphohydrolase [Planctomycetota bacterium]
MSDGEGVTLPATSEIEAESERAFLRKARTLATSVYQLVKVSQMHEMDNEVVQEPLQNVRKAVEDVLLDSASVALQTYEDTWFANHKLLKFTPKTFLIMRGFSEWLKKRGIGKIAFSSAPEIDALKTVMKALAGADRGDPEVIARSIRSSLPENIRESIRLFTVKEIESEGARVTIQTDERSFALLLYAKLLILVREHLRAAERLEAAPTLLVKIHRSGQEIVQAAERDPDRLLALLSARGASEADYLAHHALHVSILSVLLGLRVGVDRSRLAELAAAALLAFTGRAMIPREGLAKAGPLTPETRAELERHPILAARLFLKTRRVTESLLYRLVVAFEHPMQSSGYPRVRTARAPHLFARIVGLADTYDALVAPRPWRPAYRPDEALRVLLDASGSRYDGLLLRTLANLLGSFPLGTLVLLSTGERAVVLHNHAEQEKRNRPVVKRVLDARGRRIEGDLLDLSEKPDVRILRSEDPGRYNLNVMALFQA